MDGVWNSMPGVLAVLKRHDDWLMILREQLLISFPCPLESRRLVVMLLKGYKRHEIAPHMKVSCS